MQKPRIQAKSKFEILDLFRRKNREVCLGFETYTSFDFYFQLLRQSKEDIGSQPTSSIDQEIVGFSREGLIRSVS